MQVCTENRYAVQELGAKSALRPEQAFHVPRRGGGIAIELPESASQNSFSIPGSQKVADPRVSSGAEVSAPGDR